MTARYEVENLLRPPVEILSGLAAFASSAFCFSSPSFFLMSSSVAYGAGAYFLVNGVIRFKQAITVITYQSNLKRQPRFVMKSNEIPCKANALYMGRGFDFRAKHTERLFATRDRRNESFVKRGLLYHWARGLEVKVADTPLEFIKKVISVDSKLNPLRPDPPVGGDSCIHGVGTDEESERFLINDDRSGHLAVIGATSTGKTRKAEIYIKQDIHHDNNVVFVIDPKGDADLFRRTYIESVRSGRADNFYFFHLGYAEHSYQFNPVGTFSRVTEIPTRLTSGLPDSGDAKSFKDFAWQFSKFIAVAEVALGKRPTYKSVKQHIRRIDHLFIEYGFHALTEKGIDTKPIIEKESSIQDNKKNSGRSKRAIALAEFIKGISFDDPILEDLMYMFELDREYYQKIVVQIGPFLEKVTTGRVGTVLSPDYDSNEPLKRTIDIPELFKRKAVVYIGLDALTDPEVAAAVGEALFSEMTSYAGYIYKHGIDSDHPFAKNDKIFANIHADEFSDLIGPKFATLVNKSRGAGYRLTLYTQTVSDIVHKLNSESGAGQVLGNINNIEMLRVQEEKTAELVTNKLPEIKIRESISISGYQDQQDSLKYVANNQDRTQESKMPMLTPADIMSLPKGQSFTLTEGNRLTKLRSPLPSMDDDIDMPEKFIEIMSDMKKNYRQNISLRD